MGHCVLLATTFNLREGHKLQFSASVGLSHPAAEMWVHGQSWQPHTDTQGRETWTSRVKEVWRRLVVVEQESECGTEGQEQGRGWTRSSG